MSRSKHQKHPTSHNKNNRCPWPYRKRKMKPHGLKPYTGYGDECYFRSLHEEVILPICYRAYQKEQDKKEIEYQLTDEYDSSEDDIECNDNDEISNCWSEYF